MAGRSREILKFLSGVVFLGSLLTFLYWLDGSSPSLFGISMSRQTQVVVSVMGTFLWVLFTAMAWFGRSEKTHAEPIDY